MRLSNPRFLCTGFAALIILAFLNLTAHSQAFGASESILESFANPSIPFGGVIMDKGGNLYGTTALGGAYGSQGGDGTVFKLTPPTKSRGKWTESILWSLGNGTDGNDPEAGLIMDARGNLYGTTDGGGAYGSPGSAAGTVFELMPPSTRGGRWTESVLWSFGNGTDGLGPAAGLIMDASGNLYGTTRLGGASGGGTVFELTPPSTVGEAWTESILWDFGNGTDGKQPYAGLIMDKSGNLYGTTRNGGASGGGTVFELTPPSTVGEAWTESILWDFGNGTDGMQPYAGLIMDKSGNLYGATEDGGTYANPSEIGGTVFELKPPSATGGPWTESILWDFGNGTDGKQPYAGLTMDTGGNLYGTTAEGGAYGSFKGTVFELTPPTTNGETWTESILWSFGNGTDGEGPYAGLIMDSSGNFYGTTRFLTGGSRGGTVFEIATRTVLSASPTKVNFGKVEVAKTSKPKKVTLTNKGTVPAQISSVTATTPFTIAGGVNTCSGQTLAPKKSCSFEVEFAPTTVGSSSGGIDVAYDGTSPAVALTGNGIAGK